jgi:hypothetical protein
VLAGPISTDWARPFGDYKTLDDVPQLLGSRGPTRAGNDDQSTLKGKNFVRETY